MDKGQLQPSDLKAVAELTGMSVPEIHYKLTLAGIDVSISTLYAWVQREGEPASKWDEARPIIMDILRDSAAGKD